MSPATPPPPPPEPPPHIRESKEEDGLTFSQVRDAVKRTQLAKSAWTESMLEIPTPKAEESVQIDGEEMKLTESRELTPEQVMKVLANTKRQAEESSKVTREVLDVAKSPESANRLRSSQKFRRRRVGDTQ